MTQPSRIARARKDGNHDAVCERCGVIFTPGPDSTGRFCGRGCAFAANSPHGTGCDNPNWRGAGLRTCATCGETFKSYDKRRKYCSVKCRAPTPIARLREMSAVSAAKNVAKRIAAGGYKRRKRNEPGKVGVRFKGQSFKKDANHDSLVALFKQLGCSVFEAHDVGGGFPDLIIGVASQTLLVELKNPNTKYGRRGLNPTQKLFADTWRGGKVYMASTANDVIALVQHWRRAA